jgi:hypothetical protein
MYNVAPSKIFYAPPVKKRLSRKQKLVIFIIILFVITATAITISRFLKTPIKPRNFHILEIIFDETAPIPVKSADGKYGYATPADKLLIQPQYTVAERFYGEYAKVAENDTYKIINRKGEKKLDVKIVAEYYVESGLWEVDGVFYDTNLTKITSDQETAVYLNHGYLLTSSENTQKILDYTGKTIYACENSPCTVLVDGNPNSGNEFYAAVQNAVGESRLISLANGSEIIKLEKNQYLSVVSAAIYAINSPEKGVEKYLFLHEGKIAKQFPPNVQLRTYNGQDVLTVTTYAANGDQAIAYYDIKTGETTNQPRDESLKLHQYSLSMCENGKYSLKDTAGVVFECKYDNVLAFPERAFGYYSSEKNQDFFVVIDEEARLFEAQKARVVQNLGQGEITFHEDSPYFLVDSRVYSLNSPNKNLPLKGDFYFFGNYFTNNDSTYNNTFEKLEITK